MGAISGEHKDEKCFAFCLFLKKNLIFFRVGECIKGFNLLGDYRVISRDGVTVKLQRVRDAGVPEATSHLYNGDALGQEIGGVRMPENVEVSVWNARSFNDAAPRTFQIARAEGCAPGCRENQCFGRLALRQV